jgi:ribosomal protein S4E
MLVLQKITIQPQNYRFPFLQQKAVAVNNINSVPRHTDTHQIHKMLLKEGENVFIGLAVGDTTVKVTAYDMEQTIKVHIDEQVYLPGMGPSTGGSAPARRPGSKDDGDPYGGSGRFDHILKNM